MLATATGKRVLNNYIRGLIYFRLDLLTKRPSKRHGCFVSLNFISSGTSSVDVHSTASVCMRVCMYVGGKIEVEVEQKCFQFIASKFVTLQTKFTYVLCRSPWQPVVDAARL